MKINKQAIYKKIALIVVVFGILSIVETAVSKTISPKTAPAIVKPVIPVPKENVIQDIAQPSFATLSPRLQSAGKATADGGKLSLEQIHALSEGQGSEITRSLKISPVAQIQSDKFTQSQAHMSLPEIKKLIDAKYNIKPYQKMIDAIVGREVEYKDGYYVFYHGMKNLWYGMFHRIYIPAYIFISKSYLQMY